MAIFQEPGQQMFLCSDVCSDDGNYLVITVSVSPWQAGRNMMAKSEHVTFRAGAIAAACTVIFLMYLNLQSVTVLNLNPGMEDPREF